MQPFLYRYKNMTHGKELAKFHTGKKCLTNNPELFEGVSDI